MLRKHSPKGFSAVEATIVLALLITIGVGGWWVWGRSQAKTPATQPSSTTQNTPKQAVDTYGGWKTYTDVGYTLATGISVKYPADWQVVVGGKTIAWKIQNSASPTVSINVRSLYLDASKTARQEWNDCASGDACGPALGDTQIESAETSTNGLDTYSLKMQGSAGVYYATVIKGNKTTDSGVPFLEFLLNNPDAATLSVYKQILASATFSN